MIRAYSISGVTLVSDVALPSLDPLALRGAPAPGRTFTLRRAEGPITEGAEWLYHQNDDGFLIAAVGRVPDGYVLSVPGEADFRFAERGVHATFAVAPRADDAIVEWALLEHAWPIWLDLSGIRAFHAGAVHLRSPEGRSGAIAFLGRSGAGKSTLVASLCAHAGAAVLADDCLAIAVEGASAVAHPSCGGVRLWPDSAGALAASGLDPAADPHRDLPADGDKRRVRLPASPGASPLRAIVALEPPRAGFALDLLGKRDAIATLATHLYRADPSRADRLVAELDFLERLAEAVPVLRLTWARSFEQVRDLCVRLALLAGGM